MEGLRLEVEGLRELRSSITQLPNPAQQIVHGLLHDRGEVLPGCPNEGYRHIYGFHDLGPHDLRAEWLGP